METMMDRPAFKFVPEALLLDVPEIDAEHAAIFNLLACLKNCCLSAESSDPALGQCMLEKLRGHFESAERLAGMTGEDLAADAREHREILRLVAELLEAGSQGQSSATALLRHVEYWCERCIGGEDELLDACLGERTCQRRPG